MKRQKCTQCNEVKPVSEFYWRSDRNQYRKNCKSCKDLQKYIWRKHKKSSSKKAWDAVKVNTRIRLRTLGIEFERVEDFIGCDKDSFYKWIESQFPEEWEWDDYGTLWELDHQTGWRFATQDNYKDIAHYTNIRPFCVKRNRSNKDPEY